MTHDDRRRGHADRSSPRYIAPLDPDAPVPYTLTAEGLAAIREPGEGAGR